MFYKTKIKTQRMHRYIPEPVGSPAVLLVRVSNLPLRVVRSLLISIQVEGAFGVLKSDYEFQRFLLRGKNKSKTGDSTAVPGI